ncbi:hypothetical protein FQZ97_1118960 [compost metagenome]
MRGVQLQVGQVGNGREQMALVGDRLGQGTRIGGQRVAPAGFREALEQRFVIGIEVQDVALDMHVPRFLEQFRETLQLARQVARVDGHRDLRVQQFGVQQGALRQIGQQAGRQVVDAIETVVLEHIERRALARAGQAADDDQAHG